MFNCFIVLSILITFFYRFVNTTSLPKDEARRFANLLHNGGIFSSNILNMCLRSNYLTEDHLTSMEIPEALHDLILNHEPPQFEINNEITELKCWLRYCLGGL